MDVVLHRLAGCFSWCGEQWSNVDIEAKVREGRCNHFLSAVVAILSNLRDQQARPSALGDFECLYCGAHTLDGAGHADLPLINSRNRFDLGAMAAEHFLERRRDFSNGRFCPCGIDCECQQIAVAAVSSPCKCVKRLLQQGWVAFCFETLKLFDLMCANGGIVYLEHLNRLLVGRCVLINTDD